MAGDRVIHDGEGYSYPIGSFVPPSVHSITCCGPYYSSPQIGAMFQRFSVGFYAGRSWHASLGLGSDLHASAGRRPWYPVLAC